MEPEYPIPRGPQGARAHSNLRQSGGRMRQRPRKTSLGREPLTECIIRVSFPQPQGVRPSLWLLGSSTPLASAPGREKERAWGCQGLEGAPAGRAKPKCGAPTAKSPKLWFLLIPEGGGVRYGEAFSPSFQIKGSKE